MDTATAGKIELRIPARPEFLCLARLAVAAIASHLDFDIDAIEDIKTGVNEACTNAIQHATESDADSCIDIICSLEPGQLVVEVRDVGAGFDASLCCEQVDLDGHAAEDLPDRGYGLLLIRNLVDQFDCLSQPGVGTVVRMTKHRKPA